MSLNFYPEQLRRIADMCEALNQIDGVDAPESAGVTLQFTQGIQIQDEHGTPYGRLQDEIGGAWSWFPPGDSA